LRLQFLEVAVTSLEERIAMLSGRTNREAWLQLQRIRHHPNFGALLMHLERLGRQVRETDVDHAARLFLDDYDATI
jgi:hypothetical protein